MSLAWLVCRVVGLSTPREKPLQQAACGFRWSCSSDTPKILETLWLIGFKTGLKQLNNSRALISDRFVCKPKPEWDFFPRLTFQWSAALFHIKSFNSLSVHGVILFCKWRRCRRKFSNRSWKIYIHPFALFYQFRKNLKLKIPQNPVFLSILNN